MEHQSKTDECCPEFDPSRWDEKEFQWDNKPFVKETIPTLFHIPFPPMIGKKIRAMLKAAEDSNAAEENKAETLILFRDPGAFRSEIYLSVKGVVKGRENTFLSGSYIGKAYSGGFNSVPKFIRQTNAYLAAKGMKAKDYMVHYAYCPGCEKKYGNNYLVLFAKV